MQRLVPKECGMATSQVALKAEVLCILLPAIASAASYSSSFFQRPVHKHVPDTEVWNQNTHLYIIINDFPYDVGLLSCCGQDILSILANLINSPYFFNALIKFIIK